MNYKEAKQNYESKLNKILTLTGCLNDIVEILDVPSVKKLLEHHTLMIRTIVEHAKVGKLPEKPKNSKYNELTKSVFVGELPEVGSNDTLYICDGKMFFYDGPLGWIKISEDKMISAFDFVEMFDSAYEDIAEVLTRDSQKLVIRKRSMFPENFYTIEIESMSFEVYSKIELAKFLNNAGILSYTLTKMEYR